MSFEDRVRRKMTAILAAEEEKRIEEEAIRRIAEKREENAIASDDIAILAALAGECWKHIEETYPNIRHSNGDGLITSVCNTCESSACIVYKNEARAKLIGILEDKRKEKEVELISRLPVYSKLKSLLDYFVKSSNSYEIWNILVNEYPKELQAQYGIRMSSYQNPYTNHMRRYNSVEVEKTLALFTKLEMDAL